jgi:hypothetical protein
MRIGLALCIAGCASEEPGILFIVDSDLPEGEIDTVELSLTGSRSAEGDVCVPLVWTIPPASLPYDLAVVADGRYSHWVALRARGLSGGEERVRREVRLPGWPDERTEYPVSLDSVCLDTGCEAEEQCLHGSCVSVPVPGLFDDSDETGPSVDDVPCGGGA